MDASDVCLVSKICSGKILLILIQREYRRYVRCKQSFVMKNILEGDLIERRIYKSNTYSEIMTFKYFPEKPSVKFKVSRKFTRINIATFKLLF